IIRVALVPQLQPCPVLNLDRTPQAGTTPGPWYITDRNVLKTPPDQSTPSKAVGIRVFYPAGGILLFEDRMLHLFELEVELIELRVKIADALEEAKAKITGRALFGGHILEPVMSEQRAQQRFMEWQHRRAEALEELAKRKK
ncbi:hypothetical protein, partial [Micromonospora sp. NPDC050200]|uniref:hypothetical protein n=1 Tax=Micromonospora sp. NPDC050200 TaxID=3155664 RepID=UPI0033CD573E